MLPCMSGRLEQRAYQSDEVSTKHIQKYTRTVLYIVCVIRYAYSTTVRSILYRLPMALLRTLVLYGSSTIQYLV